MHEELVTENFKIYVIENVRKNVPKAWKLWDIKSSSGERRDLDNLQMNVEEWWSQTRTNTHLR